MPSRPMEPMKPMKPMEPMKSMAGGEEWWPDAGLSTEWGSGSHSRFGAGTGFEELTEAGTEFAVAQRTWSRRSAPRRDHRICCALFMRRLTRKVAVPSVSAVPTRRPAPRRIPLSAALFALEDRHDGADALEGDLGILGLAVPDPPVRAVNLRDDHRLGVLPL